MRIHREPPGPERWKNRSRTYQGIADAIALQYTAFVNSKLTVSEWNTKFYNGVRFTAGANGLPEIESSSKFRSDREATSTAQKALRSMAYENQDSGWSKFRCHARLPEQTKAFCGARIENSPNTKHAYSEPCGKCERIVESIPDPAEAENDIKKYFRYV